MRETMKADTGREQIGDRRVLICRLRHGLAQLGARHVLADARSLPFTSASVEANATEPPYEPQAEATMRRALVEMERILKPAGRLALLCAAWQAEGLYREARRLCLVSYLEAPINRKGLDVVAMAWQKPERLGPEAEIEGGRTAR